MAEDYRLPTPEAVEIAYDIAGIGSRFVAMLLDGVLQALGLALVVAGGIALWGTGSTGKTIALVAGFTLSFLIIWAYFIVFETAWKGQTPGKIALGVRVIRRDGRPIGFTEAFVRNIVRIVDFLPGFYGIGVLSMFISKQSRRLGDYAGGTIVVKESHQVSLADLTTAAGQAEQRLRPVPDVGATDPEEVTWDLAALSADNLRVMREFLDRRSSLEPQAATRLGHSLATTIAARIGAREPLDPARFLERVLALRAQERL